MLKARIITAVVLLILFSLDLFLASTQLFALVLSLLVAAGAWEWSRLSGVRHEHAQTAYGAVVGLLALICLYLPQDPLFIRWLMLLGVVYWIAMCVVIYIAPVRSPQEGVSVSLLLRGVVALVIASVAMQYFRTYAPYASPWLLLYAMSVVWLMDIGAYFAGRRFGRRKLSPLISPGKSWEGVWGGLAVTGVFVVLVVLLIDWPADRLWALITGSLAAAAISVVGDLSESRIKRSAGAKDSSRLLPGHGGVLDRIDGVIAAVPVFAFTWAWM